MKEMEGIKMKSETVEKLTKLFGGADSRLQETDPEWVEITANFSQSETVSASRLTEKERALCILSAL